MRRGAAETALIVVVVVGLVAVLPLVLQRSLLDIGQKEFTKRECQTSLLLTTTVQRGYDALGRCVSELDNPIPLKCNRRFLTVSENDVLMDGESVKIEYDPACAGAQPSARLDYSGDVCLAENVFAREMAECWSTFFEGEGLVFQQVEQELDGFFDGNEHDRACFVCAEITLQDDVTGFTEYIKSKRYSFRDVQEERSYFTYLARNPEARCNSNIRALSDDGTCWSAFGKPIKAEFFERLRMAGQEWPGLDQSTFPAGTYAVTFMRYGMEAACEVEDNQEDAPTMTVQVIPAENIGMYCDVVLA